MATAGNGRVQKILDEFRAEAKAGFGGSAAPLARSIRQESTTRSIGKMSPQLRPKGVSEEVKASLLLAIETALLPELSTFDDAASVVRAEGAANAGTRGNDVSAILAEAIANELLTDKAIQADSGSRLREETLASLKGAPRQVDRGHQPGIQGIRSAIDEAAELEAKPSRASLDAKDREMIEQAIARSIEEPQAAE